MLDTSLRPGPGRGRRAALWDLFQRIAPEPPTAVVEPARGEEDLRPTYPIHPTRAAAHAAYATVVGGGPRALDAALAVVEADLRATRLKALQQEEALKLLRLYASDEWARSVAERALEPPPAALVTCLPGFLYDADLAEGRPCSCGVHR